MHLYGVESVEDLCDPDIVGDTELAKEIGALSPPPRGCAEPRSGSMPAAESRRKA